MKDSIIHEYRLKWWAQAWYLAWGVFSSGAAVIGIYAGAFAADWSSLKDWGFLLLFIGMAVLGYFFLALALRSRVILEGTHISVRGAMRERSADSSEIEGYRIMVTKNASFWRLKLKDGNHISIMRSFRVDDYFRSFLSELKELSDDEIVNLRL